MTFEEAELALIEATDSYTRFDRFLISQMHLSKTERYSLARTMLTFENSYSRMGQALNLKGLLPLCDWLKLMGKNWSCCDNVSAHLPRLKRALPKKRPLFDMMDGAEIAAYNALPDVVRIYRGCSERNKAGVSWTLDRDVATRFPFYERYRSRSPLLITATVRKDQIIAVKLDRNESEIITFGAVPESVEPITQPPVMDKPAWVHEGFDEEWKQAA